MTHDTARRLFVDALYGELSPEDRKSFDEHLADCNACAKEFQDLEGVAGVMSLRERDELGPEDWKAFWNVLASAAGARSAPHTGPARKKWTLIGRPIPALRFGVVAILIFVIGVSVGRFGLSPGDDTAEGRSPVGITPVESAALRDEAMGYLERSKILLLGVVNADEIVPERGQLSRQQEVSRVLVSEGGDLRAKLNRSGQQQLEELVADLEVLLLQIANLEIENDFPGLEIIRGGVDRKGILLKINVEQMKAQQQRSAPLPRVEEHTSRSMI